jgi:hypothetical protein
VKPGQFYLLHGAKCPLYSLAVEPELLGKVFGPPLVMRGVPEFGLERFPINLFSS